MSNIVYVPPTSQWNRAIPLYRQSRQRRRGLLLFKRKWRRMTEEEKMLAKLQGKHFTEEMEQQLRELRPMRTRIQNVVVYFKQDP